MSNKTVAIVDYGMGNLRSIKVSLNYLGVKNALVINAKQLKKYSHIILPGVGSFKKAIKNLKSDGMFNEILEISKKKKTKNTGNMFGNAPFI